ncbi:MAG: DNA-processing protein DprA [Celeribacter sp.]
MERTGVDLFSSPPPLAPPTTEEQLLDWLCLLRSRRVGPASFRRLMAAHGNNAAAALDALPGIAAQSGTADYRPCPRDQARTELRLGHRARARLIAIGAPDYPPLLAQLDDAPPLLWAIDAGRGDGSSTAQLLTTPGIALIGARNASSLGLRMAGMLARDLGRAGVPVVSGLARGIDASAHRAALDSGTVAVIAGGIDTVYPRENAALTADIARQGVILSEMPPGTQPRARHFPRRNRIVSGLVRAVVVVEAAARSGSLMTARIALDQGREVLAVPGHPLDPRAAGTNMLLRDGARLVRSAADVLDALDLPALPRAGQPTAASAPYGRAAAARSDSPPPPGAGSGLRQRIHALIGATPIPEAQLFAQVSGTPAAHLLATLQEMEIDGEVQRLPGGYLSRE